MIKPCGRSWAVKHGLTVLLLLSVAFTGAAQATGFKYSYTFNSGWRASGFVSGDQSGLYVVNVSNVTLIFDCPFPTCLGPNSTPDGLPIYAMSWNYTIHFWDKTLPPVVSFDASLNNFLFINQPNYPPDFNSATLRFFAMQTVDPLYPYELPPVTAQDSTVSRGDGDITVNGSWSLMRIVPIDIQPGSTVNPINLKKQGAVSVAIFSSADLNAPAQVDPTSLTFGRTGDEASFLSCSKHPRNVNMDGLADLVCSFSIPAAGFQVGDTEGVLKGRTISGTPFIGTDIVTIAPGK